LEETLKYLYIVLFILSNSVYADEFNWDDEGITTSKVKLISNSESINVTVGSICGYGSTCDIAAKYLTKDLKEVEFFRTISNGKAGLKVEKNAILIFLVYTPIGSNKVLNVTKHFEWDIKLQKLNEI